MIHGLGTGLHLDTVDPGNRLAKEMLAKIDKDSSGSGKPENVV